MVAGPLHRFAVPLPRASASVLTWSGSARHGPLFFTRRRGEQDFSAKDAKDIAKGAMGAFGPKGQSNGERVVGCAKSREEACRAIAFLRVSLG